MNRRLLLAVISVASALACLSPASFAQSYPAKTVKIIAPVAPGGGVDLVARTMADRYTKALGQTFIVENQSGGGGVIASQATARAAPDGYILMLGYVGTHGTIRPCARFPTTRSRTSRRSRWWAARRTCSWCIPRSP